MPPAGAIAAAAVIALVLFAGEKAVHRVKKGFHEIGCLIHTGRKCGE